MSPFEVPSAEDLQQIAGPLDPNAAGTLLLAVDDKCMRWTRSGSVLVAAAVITVSQPVLVGQDWLLASNLLVDAGRVADGRKWCDAIDEATLDAPILRQEYAVLLVKLGDFDRAISRFNDLISKQPKTAEPHFYRGLAFHRLHRATEARRDLEAFLRLAHGDSPFIAQAKALLKQLAGSR